ncbi:MAG TPA: NAD-dependent epimerase/dehydratase family protein [Vicinamibacterales bacterium]|nr:NAD-dependent epimerase/dehydratase family protein [Vicinamibacterales bacterium]
MKALVTGAAGFIGSHVAERLLESGATVLGIDNFAGCYPRAEKERNLVPLRAHAGFRFVEATLGASDPAPLLEGVSHVFHLAGQPGVRKSWGADFRVYTESNIVATQALLEACAGRPIERVVFASSSSVYGDDVPLPMREEARLQPVSPYGVTKLAAEQLCHVYHISHSVPTVSLRYFTVYGPRQRPDMAFRRFFDAAMGGNPVMVFGDGRQTRDFTYVADAVSGTIAAATRGRPGTVYNVGGGSRVEVRDVLELVRRITGQPVRIERSAAQRGDMRDTYAETARARADLAFRPAVTLEQGLRAQFDWMVQAGLFERHD